MFVLHKFDPFLCTGLGVRAVQRQRQRQRQNLSKPCCVSLFPVYRVAYLKGTKDMKGWLENWKLIYMVSESSDFYFITVSPDKTARVLFLSLPW
jgi:hypothetical protein